MARKKASGSRGAWLGLVLGMVLGVGAAVAVALFVTQAPMPFKDKASRSTPGTLLPDVANAPDPNISLYGKDGPAGTRSQALGGSSTNPPAPAPNPGEAPENPLSDAIGQIIAGIDKQSASKPSADSKPPIVASAKPSSVTPPPMARPSTNLPVPPPPPPPASTRSAPGTQTTYYLQTGAFRSKDEAQAMLARVVLLGLPVHVEAGEASGAPINRVRVGPFKGIDDMNRARTKLGDDKIQSTVVRP